MASRNSSTTVPTTSSSGTTNPATGGGFSDISYSLLSEILFSSDSY